MFVVDTSTFWIESAARRMDTRINIYHVNRSPFSICDEKDYWGSYLFQTFGFSYKTVLTAIKPLTNILVFKKRLQKRNWGN